jgi:lysophospholipase L1-like esterase
MAACVLVGCGGASSTVNPLTPTRIIAFGDEFSTVDYSGYGTYTVNTYETNTTVASRLAATYGLTMYNYSTLTGGVVSSGTAISYAAATATALTTVPAQITTYLTYNTPGSSDLFIITAGTNDIISAAPSNNTTAISSAATALTTAIQKLTTAGAQYVLVMQPINVARTPSFLSGTYASYAQALSYDSGTLCQSFSCLLSTKLNSAYPATSSHQPILLADLMSYFNLVTGTTSTGSSNTYTSYGVTNPNTAVCSSALPSCTTTSGLLTTYSSTYATSVFADSYYLTPFANRLLADYIYNYNFYRAGWR